MTEKFPTITKHNIPAWKSLTYQWLLHGMLQSNLDLKYGESMIKADKLNNVLYRALGKELRKKK